MSRRKKPVHKVVMTEGKCQIIANLLSEYDIKSANDIFYENFNDCLICCNRF